MTRHLCLRLVMFAALASSCASGGGAQPAGEQAVPSAVKAERLQPHPVPSCGQFRATFGGLTIALAPPAGFAEICSQDQKLCSKLTSGYPPSVPTVGYFVPAEKWAALQRGQHAGLTPILVAQDASTDEADFPALKNFLRERNGRIPDNSRLTETERLKNEQRIDLGVLDEGADFISQGVILQADMPALGLSLGPQAAINTAFLTQGRVLSLYTHCSYAERQDVEGCRRLTAEWLACMRRAAPASQSGAQAPSHTGG